MGDKREYYNGTYTYDEMLFEIKYNSDFWFSYKGQPYYLTDVNPKMKPSIIKWFYDQKNEPEIVLAYYETFEELLSSFVFDDGVGILDALKSKFIENV